MEKISIDQQIKFIDSLIGDIHVFNPNEGLCLPAIKESLMTLKLIEEGRAETQKVKSEIDIQKAHDLLIGFLTETIVVDEPLETEMLTASCDVLCWVLGHDHNDTFELNMAKLKDMAVEAGYEMRLKEDDDLPAQP